jgi:hypothetical protein
MRSFMARWRSACSTATTAVLNAFRLGGPPLGFQERNQRATSLCERDQARPRILTRLGINQPLAAHTGESLADRRVCTPQGLGELADRQRAGVPQPDERIDPARPDSIEATSVVHVLDLGVDRREQLS